MLIDIICLKLIKYNQYKKLHKNFLTEELKNNPKEQIIPLSTLLRSILAYDITVLNRLIHVEIPIFTCRVNKQKLKS
jgi:hypothetical protein